MNDIDYDFGNDDVPLGAGDNRLAYRLAGSAGVTLELEAPEPDETGTTPGRHLVSRTRDLSVKGFCLVTSEPLTENALLSAWIKLDGEQVTLQLTVDVIWCRPQGGGSWLVGLHVLESGDAAYMDWVDAIARAMSGD